MSYCNLRRILLSRSLHFLRVTKEGFVNKSFTDKNQAWTLSWAPRTSNCTTHINLCCYSRQSEVSEEPKIKKKSNKQRLDSLCAALHPQLTLHLINSYILRGKVKVDDKVVTTPGFQVSKSCSVEIDTSEPKYVCRGGFKLEKALSHFGIDVRGKVALDSGQSTGGFSDCLLQSGAAKVIGIDVGFNQLHEKIRNDPRVLVIERFNLRYLAPEDLPCKVEIATLDLSFISVLTVLPAVRSVLVPGADLVVLVKPQFEAPRRSVMRGGVVTDPKVRDEAVQRVVEGARLLGFASRAITESPLLGERGGNVELLVHLQLLEDAGRCPRPSQTNVVGDATMVGVEPEGF